MMRNDGDNGSRGAIRVHHYFPMGSGNIGDHMVARAIRGEMPEFFGGCEFLDVPVGDRYEGKDREIGLRGANVDRSNAEADLVVIGGSNLLEPKKPRRVGGKGAKRGRWGVMTDVESIERLRVPVMLIGMGTGSSFGKGIRPYSEPASSEVRALFRKAFAHSVRDVTTVEELRKIGVETRCTGCPVTFLTEAEVGVQSEGPLAVSLPPYYIRDSLLGKWFMRGTLGYIRWLVERGVPTVVTLHEDRDVAFAREYLPRPNPPVFDVFYTESLEEQLERFRGVRGVVGFRLHAALTGMALGKPVIPVGLDWRGKGFIRTIGAEDWSVWPGRWGEFGKLRRVTEKLLAGDAELIGKQARAKAGLLGKHRAFLAEAAERFRAVRGG